MRPNMSFNTDTGVLSWRPVAEDRAASRLVPLPPGTKLTYRMLSPNFIPTGLSPDTPVSHSGAKPGSEK